MKKRLLCLLLLCGLLAGCGTRDYVLTESNFFLIMTNMQFYPQQYLGSEIELDCFTYALKDVHGQRYICGVRKSSAEYGCTCGKDTIIGFLLQYDGQLPEPRNQSTDDGDKTWLHLRGRLAGEQKQDIEIHAYLPDGSQDPENTETISFLSFQVDDWSPIEDASGLQYYVTK